MAARLRSRRIRVGLLEIEATLLAAAVLAVKLRSRSSPPHNGRNTGVRARFAVRAVCQIRGRRAAPGSRSRAVRPRLAHGLAARDALGLARAWRGLRAVCGTRQTVNQLQGLSQFVERSILYYYRNAWPQETLQSRNPRGTRTRAEAPDQRSRAGDMSDGDVHDRAKKR